MRRHRRPPSKIWQQKRQQVWQRDEGRCQGPYCENTLPFSLPLERTQIDHIMELSCGGSNELNNLRTLCRRCHTLRASKAHQGLIAEALKDEIIPADWRSLVWE